MKLYHYPKTRSVRPLWLLEELGAAYQLETINVFEGEGQSPDYLAINPGGSVPTLDDNGTIIYEAGAICMYLTDKYPEKQLMPAINTPQRGLYYQWMFYVPATMELPLVNIFLHTAMLPEEKRRPAIVEDSKERFIKIAANINNALTDKQYILGEQFSTADIMIGTTLLWFPELMEGFEALQGYTERLLARPAFQKARSL
jgi:glutathione S-transferase